MKVIQKQDTLISKVFFEKELDVNKELRLLSYVFDIEVDEGRLLFNSLTKELILLEHNEDVINYLYQHRFVVYKDNDDRKLVDSIRKFADLFSYKKTINDYTILTTTHCNARCFYCYEANYERITMNNSIAIDISEYILNHCNKENKVHISWFGGEPLCNQKVINYISQKLIENNIKLTSTMITNGYLFDKNLVNLAKNVWKLNKVQITLDGTRDIYNIRKNYIYDNDNSFDIVIRNIHYLLENEIFVNIRLNLDENNFEDLLTLIDFIDKEFTEKKFLSVYSHLIFQSYLLNDNEANVNKLYKKESILINKIKEKKLAKEFNIEKNIKTNNCLADSGKSVVILPDGRLHSCEHVCENFSWGTIYDDKRRKEALNYWKEKYNGMDDCASCPLYCDCIKLKHCPDTNEVCYKQERINKINEKKERILNTYLNYKNGCLNED